MCGVDLQMTIWMSDVVSRERKDLSKITVLLGCLAVPGSLFSPGIFTTEDLISGASVHGHWQLILTPSLWQSYKVAIREQPPC